MTRLWRWLCCRTGHHRETVDVLELCDSTELRCMDCGKWRPLSKGKVRTPSRRYALRGKA